MKILYLYRSNCDQIHNKPEECHVQTADNVILAVPVPALQRIKFTPKLGLKKSMALEQTSYTKYVKIYLIFHRPFWHSDPMKRAGGVVVTELSNKEVYYPAYNMSRAGKYQRSNNYAYLAISY